MAGKETVELGPRHEEMAHPLSREEILDRNAVTAGDLIGQGLRALSPHARLVHVLAVSLEVLGRELDGAHSRLVV
jgi:hypothetical protein